LSRDPPMAPGRANRTMRARKVRLRLDSCTSAATAFFQLDCTRGRDGHEAMDRRPDVSPVRPPPGGEDPGVPGLVGTRRRAARMVEQLLRPRLPDGVRQAAP